MLVISASTTGGGRNLRGGKVGKELVVLVLGKMGKVQGGQVACGAGNEGKPTALESRRTNHPVNLFRLIRELNITEARIVFV